MLNPISALASMAKTAAEDAGDSQDALFAPAAPAADAGPVDQSQIDNPLPKDPESEAQEEVARAKTDALRPLA